MICQDCGKPLVHEKARRKLEHSSCEAEAKQLRGLVGRLVEGLKRLEWSHKFYEEVGYTELCPACDWPKGNPHAPNCWLAALVAEAEREKGAGRG